MIPDPNTPQFQKAWIAGCCFVATCIFSLSFLSVSSTLGVWVVRYGGLILVFALYFATLVIHLQGYIALAAQKRSLLLARSTKFVIASLVFLGFAMVASVNTGVFNLEYATLAEANALDGMATIVLFIFGSLFAIAVLRMYQELGFWAIVIAPIPVVAGWFFWNPWFAALLVAFSSLFFYRKTIEN